MDRLSTNALKDYEGFVNKIMKMFDSAGRVGSSPDKVAEVIYKAATDNKRKLRYVSGIDAKLVLTMRRILPERLFLWVIKKAVAR